MSRESFFGRVGFIAAWFTLDALWQLCVDGLVGGSVYDVVVGALLTWLGMSTAWAVNRFSVASHTEGETA